MKTIKVTKENAAAIEAALREANGKATAHTYTGYGQIAELAERAEENLLGLVAKKDAVGAKLYATSGEKVASSYRSQRNGTTVTLERRSTGWHLMEAKAVALFQEGGKPGQLFLTEQQSDLAVERFKKRLGIIKAA